MSTLTICRPFSGFHKTALFRRTHHLADKSPKRSHTGRTPMQEVCGLYDTRAQRHQLILLTTGVQNVPI